MSKNSVEMKIEKKVIGKKRVKKQDNSELIEEVKDSNIPDAFALQIGDNRLNQVSSNDNFGNIDVEENDQYDLDGDNDEEE